MKREFPGYRRLARGAFSCSSLWAGAEHLLYVKGTGFLVPIVEEYRRLRFRDIQAVSFARTQVSTWVVAGCAVGALGCAIPAALATTTLVGAAGELPGTIALAVVTLVFTVPFLLGFLAVLGWNLVRGPSAVLAIQTPTAVFVIRPANRVRIARALLGELAPLIAERQRDLASASPAGPPAAGSGSGEPSRPGDDAAAAPSPPPVEGAGAGAGSRGDADVAPIPPATPDARSEPGPGSTADRASSGSPPPTPAPEPAEAPRRTPPPTPPAP